MVSLGDIRTFGKLHALHTEFPAHAEISGGFISAVITSGHRERNTGHTGADIRKTQIHVPNLQIAFHVYTAFHPHTVSAVIDYGKT